MGNMKFRESEYIDCDPFEGDIDVDVRCQSVKLVKVRKEHQCHLSLIDGNVHTIKPGEMARFEKAIVDGEWGSYYCCIPCMDKWFTELGVTMANGLSSRCDSCCEEMPRGECPKSKRECGHHCNHIWSHGYCCWCGKDYDQPEDLHEDYPC